MVDANRIIVLDEGRVREQGSHESLIEADGLYASLWRMQQKKNAQNQVSGPPNDKMI